MAFKHKADKVLKFYFDIINIDCYLSAKLHPKIKIHGCAY